MLNVVKEKEARMGILNDIHTLLDQSGTAYFSVYNAKKTDNYVEENGVVGQETTKGWQNCQNNKFYIEEIKEVFNTVSVKDGYIVAKKG